MKRTLLTSFACLSLFAALPAISSAHQSEHPRGDHHAGERHDAGERHHNRHRDRVEHFRRHGTLAPASSTVGTVRSFNAGVLTIALNDGSIVSGLVTERTDLSCRATGHDFITDDGGPGPSGSRDQGDHGDRGDQGDDRDDRGDRGDDNDDRGQCLIALQTAGAGVSGATLDLSSAGAVWDRIDLTT